MGINILSVITGVILLLVLFLTGAGMYFYRTAVFRQRKEFLRDNPDLTSGTSGETWGMGKEWLSKQNCKMINIKGYKGFNLCGYYLAAASATAKTAILVHGYTSKGKDMAAFAQYYCKELGFNVLMPDCRGHGESEGDYIGFGWHDRLDIMKWIDYIIEKGGQDAPQIILHGISMGGATVLMTSGEKLPPNVKCIISDCAYTSVKGILGYQMRRMYRLPNFPLIHITSLICKLKSGYLFSEASALAQVVKCKLPVLFIHGGDDKFVPTEMVYQLYEAANCDKQLFIVNKAGHGDSFWVDTEGYKRQLEGFFKKHV